MKRVAALLALTLVANAPEAQVPGTYEIAATQADLDDGGTLSGAVPTCLFPAFAGGENGQRLAFFDAASGALAVHAFREEPGARTSLLVSAEMFDTLAGADVVACRDATPEVGDSMDPTDVVFLALATADGRDLVVRFDMENGALTRLTDLTHTADTADGIMGIVEVEGTLYLARSQRFGAPEDGVYTLDPETESQAPLPLLTHPDLDPAGIAYGDGLIDRGPGLFLVSSEFGQGAYRNVLTVVTGFREGTPELAVAARPCDGPSPLFSDCDDGGLEAVEADIELNGGDAPHLRVLLSNGSSSGPDGEVVGSYGFGEVPEPIYPGEIVFSEAGLRAATGISGLTVSAANGYLSAPIFTSVLYVAGSGELGGTPGIYSVVTPFETANEPTPGEQAAVSIDPNPASGATTVRLTLASPEASVRVSVFDARGREVAVLASGARARASTRSRWTRRLWRRASTSCAPSWGRRSPAAGSWWRGSELASERTWRTPPPLGLPRGERGKWRGIAQRSREDLLPGRDSPPGAKTPPEAQPRSGRAVVMRPSCWRGSTSRVSTAEQRAMSSPKPRAWSRRACSVPRMARGRSSWLPW